MSNQEREIFDICMACFCLSKKLKKDYIMVGRVR